MTICISEQGCKKNDISLGEVLLLLAICNKVDLDIAHSNLIDKGYITATRDELFNENGFRITRKGSEILDSVILDSDKTTEPENNLTNLAKKLKEIYPKGKKEGTNYYWADGVALIIRRLQLFFKKYGRIYSDEQIITATEKYVQGFNGDYTYMKLLKYFLLKEKLGKAGDVEGESELITYIENAGQEDELGSNWTSTLN